MTAQQIEAVLAEFRAWLERAAVGEAAAELEAQPAPDLHTLLGEMIALRHEVNLQTRATRSQQEQNDETLRQLRQALEALREGSADRGAAVDEEACQRPLLKALVDVYDALSLSRREMQRLQPGVWASLEAVPNRAPSNRVVRPRGFLSRIFRGAHFPRSDAAGPVSSTEPSLAGRARQLIDAMIAGYSMSLQRIERALEQAGLEPIPTVGRVFEPEAMEAVEVATVTDRPGGEVIEEVRRGYRWHGRIFRCAQVRVAKLPAGTDSR